MRLFIAAELPEALFEALSETSALLREQVRGRYVAPDRFHVTLAFLGETDAARVGEIAELIDDACVDMGPIHARLGALGSFGRRKSATLWQAVESDGALEELAGALRARLWDAGFSFDDKGFLAHMTLMRSADLTSGALPMPLMARGEIDTVALFKSDLSGPHPVYTALHTAVLG
jgi:2'-5' RNA ligase